MRSTFRRRRRRFTLAAVAELKQRHFAANIRPVGAKIAEFQLQDHDGKRVSSSDLLAKGRLVLCFIRGRWCPFCVGQMEAMNLILPEIEHAGATPVAISPQTVKQSFFMRDQHKLRFPLLSDAGNNVARQFGLTYRVPDEQRAIYQRPSSTCRSSMVMRVGSCRFPRHTLSTATGLLFTLRRTRITRNGLNRAISSAFYGPAPKLPLSS